MRSHLPAADFAERKPAPSPVENGQIAAFGLATYENGRMLSNMEFEWDATKAAANLGKHGVSFERATLVFDDPARLTVVDTRTPLRGEKTPPARWAVSCSSPSPIPTAPALPG
jgi:hypothetical protein